MLAQRRRTLPRHLRSRYDEIQIVFGPVKTS
jgi:hypothetical protein